MVSEEKYNEIISEIISEFGANNSKYFCDYPCFRGIWDDFQEVNREKIQFADVDNETVQLGYVFSIRWGLTAMSAKTTNIGLLFQGLFTSIANTSLAIIKLSIDGLDYQANILVRNLYELCFTLINIIIDSEKRNALFNAARDENEYEIWRKYFAFGKLDETIKEYENKIDEAGHLSFLNKWRKEGYHFYSSYAHNDFASFLLWSFSLPNTEDRLMFNLWGAYATRVEEILISMNSLLWYVDLLFIRAIQDKNVDFFKEEIVDNNQEEFWNSASFFGLFADKYYVKLMDDRNQDKK